MANLVTESCPQARRAAKAERNSGLPNGPALQYMDGYIAGFDVIAEHTDDSRRYLGFSFWLKIATLTRSDFTASFGTNEVLYLTRLPQLATRSRLHSIGHLGQHNIDFAGSSGAGGTRLVDDVSVTAVTTAVPEPANLALLATRILGVAAVRQRWSPVGRKKKIRRSEAEARGSAEGRWSWISTRDKVEGSGSLDINQLNKAGYPRPDQWAGWQWTRGGKQVAWIELRRKADLLRISYRFRRHGGKWQDAIGAGKV